MPPSSSRSGKQPIPAPKLPQKKAIACQSCHARKIRCSGTKPCNNCTSVSDCIYPKRDRQVRVHQSFLDRILQENADLRALQHPAEQSARKPEKDTWDTPAISHSDHESVEKQSIQGSDWFTHIRTSDTPIWIGEISDSAFATRFRQFASFSQTPCHIPRTQFVSDEALHSLATAHPSTTWPSLSRARLLVETALRFLRHNYHIVRRSEVFSTLRATDFNQISLHSKAKLWALFAVGELRSSKCLTATGHLPGLAYFAMASDAIRIINERPQIDVIETVLLLTNRRHSACTFVGTALRLATIMGLHIKIGSASIPDPEIREHRVRLWWSVYIIDRFLSSKIGLPLLISDADISIDLPSTNSALNPEDFGDHLEFVATLRLAKIAGHISRSLYVRTPQQRGTFLQQVAQIQEELNQWNELLPSQLKPHFGHSSDSERQLQPTTVLHLTFNQLLIVATRPLLLFVFRHHIDERSSTGTELPIPDQTQCIIDACISAARQSCDLLSQCWVNGEFHIFDYFYVQHLFSAAVILAIAGALGRDTSQEEIDEFNLAAGFLQQLEQNGNHAAMEFYAHIQEIHSTLRKLRSTSSLSTSPENALPHYASSSAQFVPGEKRLAVGSLADFGHDLQTTDETVLDVSFIDDWIYEDALEKLCW
uniref:Zn(2)-C6 fungal-type domain-containing protein n=1 Tax=Bionectria ochroleuca TaxID=29856 RepID=A0A0B7KI93_BIOOC